MAAFSHNVQRQSLTVECDSAECAFELRTRLSDYNLSHLLPVIEQVLSEVDVPGRQIRIERLEVDLGNIELSEFEEVAAGRLYRALKEAVELALNSPLTHSDKSESESRVAVLEWYLVRGSMPYWALIDTFSLGAWIHDLAEQDPASLSTLLRRLGTQDHVLERIVFQLSTDELRELIRVLDPEHVTLLLAYLADLKRINDEAPLTVLEDQAFDNLLWFLVLSYLTRDAGSGFNRKAFVESLIQGFAARHQRDYLEVLGLLGMGLDRTLRKYGLPSSLPAVIAELLAESPIDSKDVATSSGDKSESVDDQEWPYAEPSALVELVRAHASDLAWLERLVRRLDETTVLLLIGLLEPEHAAAIIPFLLDIRFVHREDPIVGGEAEQFDHLLWVLALSWVVHESGSQFNRKAFLGSLIERVAQSQGLDFDGVLRTFQRGLSRSLLKAPLRSSLAAIMAGLLEDIQFGRGLELFPTSTVVNPSQLAELKSLLESESSQLNPVERVQFVSALLSQLTLEEVRQLISTMMPALGRPGSHIAEALRNALQAASNPQAFLSHLMVAILKGDSIDFEVLLEESNRIPTISADFEAWDSEALEVALNVRLALSSTGWGDDASVPIIVLKLLRQDSVSAHRFLREITERSELKSVLLRSSDSAALDSIIDNLAGPHSQALRSLLDAIEALPNSDRPPLGVLRSLLLAETLKGDPLGTTEISFLSLILRQIFPTGISPRVRDALLSSTPLLNVGIQNAILEIGATTRQSRKLKKDEPRSVFEILGLIKNLHETTASSETDQLIRDLDAAIESNIAFDLSAVRELLADPVVLLMLVGILPRATWHRLVQKIAPASYRSLLEASEILESVWISTLKGLHAVEAQEAVRTALLETLFDGTPTIEGLRDRVLARFESQSPTNVEVREAFRFQTERIAEAAGHSVLRKAVASVSTSDSGKKAPMSKPSFKPTSADSYSDDSIYVDNAGIVLTGPFLPHFFTTLKLLELNEKGVGIRWLDSASASRAVHLLQYLVDGRTSVAEPKLALNKILCGLPISTPIERQIFPTEEEKQICQQLMEAMIANWTPLGSSTAEAISETFFIRQGRLDRDGPNWKLFVQRKTVDVLVDQVPWGFGVIYHEWMPSPLQVNW